MRLILVMFAIYIYIEREPKNNFPIFLKSLIIDKTILVDSLADEFHSMDGTLKPVDHISREGARSCQPD